MPNAAVVTTDFQRHQADFSIIAEQATPLRLKLHEEVTTQLAFLSRYIFIYFFDILLKLFDIF